jgi:hypothetical protein
MEKFQRTRAIRFKLEPTEHIGLVDKEVEALQKQSDKKQNCIDLVTNGLALRDQLHKLISRHSVELKLKKDVEVKYTWLRLYTKTEYYDYRKSLNENKKIFSIKEVPYLEHKLSEWFENWKSNLDLLNGHVTKTTDEQHNLNRKPEIGLIIKALSQRNAFAFIKEFIDSINLKNDSKDKLEAMGKEVDRLLKLCEKDFLPTQSMGYPIVQASLNYYTIFKNTKGLEEKKSKLIKDNITEETQCLIESLNNDSLRLNQIRYIDDRIDENRDSYIALSELATSMKLYKARAKSKFLENIQKNQDMPFDEAKKHLLFGSFKIQNRADKGKSQSDVFADFMCLNKKLHPIHKSKQSTTDENNEDLKEIANLRGKYFTTLKDNKTYFNEYVNYCEKFRKVAQKAGLLRARIKGIDKEKLESQRLQYWAVVMEQEGTQYIAFIPKNGDKAKKAYEYYLQQPICNSSKIQNKLFYFESLTHRALEKLCFGGIKEKTNTFCPEIQKELTRQKYPMYHRENKNGFFDFIDGEYWFNDKEGIKNESLLIKFYKDVLNTKYARTALKGVPWDQLKREVLDKDFGGDFESFRQALEKFSYIKQVVSKENLLSELSSKYNAQIFKITTLDLRKKEQKNLKEHTNVWKNFWDVENEQNVYPIRINPQLSIFWRDSKLSREEKYGKESELYDVNKKNRYLHPQYTLATTITENATTQKINVAFQDAQSKKEQIDQFNEKLSKTFNAQYSFGIDTGIVELATLVLAKKDKNGEIKPQLFTVYELKDLNFSKKGYVYNDKGERVIRKEPYRAVKNLSYFLDEKLYEKTFRDGKFQETFDELFDKKNVCAIDLTTAKVINGKIIINGDIISYLNLKVLNAKRKIYQELINNPSSKLQEKDYKLYFEHQNSVYASKKEFDCVRSYEEIRQELVDYVANKKKNPVWQEENINKARKASVGNAVGVISYLYQLYEGVIAMEDLRQSTIESDRKAFEGHIARVLEFALYRKFIRENLVPPMLSEIVQLRESGKLTEIGIVKFVSEKSTSLSCPVCGEKAYKSSSNEQYIKDKEMKIFRCNHCTFHNKDNPKGYDSLDSNDKIAAFNIAKRGFIDLKNRVEQ